MQPSAVKAAAAVDILGSRDQASMSMIRRLSLVGGGTFGLGSAAKQVQSRGHKAGSSSLVLAPNLFSAAALTGATPAARTNDRRGAGQATTSLPSSSFITPVRPGAAPMFDYGPGPEASSRAIEGDMALFGESPGSSAAPPSSLRAGVVARPGNGNGLISTASASAILVSTPSRNAATAQGN